MEAKLLHTEEVAKVLGVSRRTANDLMNMRTLNVTSAMMRGKFILNHRPAKNLRSFALVLAK